jgi:hypothetical protein
MPAFPPKPPFPVNAIDWVVSVFPLRFNRKLFDPETPPIEGPIESVLNARLPVNPAGKADVDVEVTLPEPEPQM